MKDDPNQQQSGAEKRRDNFHVVLAGCTLLALCATLFTRVHQGVRSFWGVPYAFIGMLAYASANNSRPMLYYVGAWAVMALYKRIRADPEQESLYLGWPVFLRTLRFEGLSKMVEAALVAGLGYALMPYDEPMGRFFVLIALPMVILESIHRQYRFMQDRAMKDAEIAMRSRMARR